MSLPLSGITVVSLEQAIAAPLASRHLADWGARIIKIERPGNGDFCRDYDTVMNGMGLGVRHLARPLQGSPARQCPTRRRCTGDVRDC